MSSCGDTTTTASSSSGVAASHGSGKQASTCNILLPRAWPTFRVATPCNHGQAGFGAVHPSGSSRFLLMQNPSGLSIGMTNGGVRPPLSKTARPRRWRCVCLSLPSSSVGPVGGRGRGPSPPPRVGCRRAGWPLCRPHVAAVVPCGGCSSRSSRPAPPVPFRRALARHHPPSLPRSPSPLPRPQPPREERRGRRGGRRGKRGEEEGYDVTCAPHQGDTPTREQGKSSDPTTVVTGPTETPAGDAPNTPPSFAGPAESAWTPLRSY